jgi:hypothetical protein
VSLRPFLRSPWSRHAVKIQRSNNVLIFSNHITLNDFGSMLVQSLGARPLKQRVNLYLGLHKFPAPIALPGLNIGIQTEHLIDESGNPMWKALGRDAILRAVRSYDAILDISSNNQPYYSEQLSDKQEQKIFCGPHIFPDQPAPWIKGKGAQFLFFGSLNERRSHMIDTLKSKVEIRVVENNIFGPQLEGELRDCSHVVNIHYKEGSYCEAPRLLRAVLSGKPVVSEHLGTDFEQGVHYQNILDLNAPIGAKESFDALSNYASQHFSILAKLDEIISSSERS